MNTDETAMKFWAKVEGEIHWGSSVFTSRLLPIESLGIQRVPMGKVGLKGVWETVAHIIGPRADED